MCGRVAVTVLMDGPTSSATRVRTCSTHTHAHTDTHTHVRPVTTAVASTVTGESLAVIDLLYLSTSQRALRAISVRTAPSTVSVKMEPAVILSLGAAAARPESVETCARMVSETKKNFPLSLCFFFWFKHLKYIAMFLPVCRLPKGLLWKAVQQEV